MGSVASSAIKLHKSMCFLTAGPGKVERGQRIIAEQISQARIKICAACFLIEGAEAVQPHAGVLSHAHADFQNKYFLRESVLAFQVVE